MQYLKSLIPFQQETVGSDRIRKVLSLALIVGLLQTFSFTYQVVQAPAAKAATTYAPAAATSLTIPTGVSSISFTIYGGGGGNGGLDCGAGCTLKTAGARGKVTGTFTVVAGDVIGIFPGYAGTSGTGSTNGGGGSGGADTYASGNYNGGNGGNAGSAGSSGGGGGGGAASILTKNSSVWAVAGGASGAGGNANLANSGQNGNNDNSSSTGTTNGGNGVQTLNTTNNGAGKSCTIQTNDGGGGGGGGGGVNGGSGGNLTNAGSGECSGLAGYRGGNSLDAAITSTTNGTDASANTSNGAIEITMQLSTPSSITTSGSIQSFTVSWATAAAAQSFSLKIYNAAGNSLLQTVSVASGTYTKTITNADFASIASGTTYQVSVTAIGNSEAPYADSAESSKVLVTTSTPSDIDSAISLNGTSQSASASGAQVIPTSTADTFSVAAWIRQPASRASGTNYQILSQGIGGNQFYLKVFNGSVIFTRSGYSVENTCAVGVPTDEWTHVAVVVGATSQSCYINGSLAGSFTQNSTTAIGTTFAVGQYVPSGGENFLGQIDEVKVWNTSRTQSQIQGDLKTYGGSLANGLVAYYDFNELVGNTVLNRSTGGSGALNLTTIGTPTITSTSIIETSTVQAYTVVRFMRNYLVSSGGYKFPDTSTAFQYLIVGGGGGGGGGFNGGGGGGGGFRESTTIVNTSSPISVVVGQGGNGAVTGFGPTNGETSTIFGISSTGGGKGATEQQVMSGPSAATTPDGKPTSGGSGGGGGHGATNSGLNGAAGNSGGYTPIEGFAGGAGNSNSSNGCCYALGGGGGGGSGGAGAAASPDGLGGSPGRGGIGRTSYITGNELSLAGGGGGAGRYGSTGGPRVRGSTASHGGGSGAENTSAELNATINGVRGSTNTGGGGGGGASTLTGTAGGGNGGSGLIVVRYITSKPTILTQPLSDTTTVGTVDTFTITTSVAPAPLTKSVQWQFTADTTTAVVANITGWTNLSAGTGFTTDTFTTIAVTKAMNKYRYRAIVTFSDTATISVQETSTVAILTVNDSITITSDTSTITRKYGDTQSVRTIVYSGGTTNTGAVGTSTSHTLVGQVGNLASGRIYVDTSTSTTVFRVDTRTAVGTYVETVTVTDARGATASYAQRVVVNPADTITITSGTPATLTYSGAQAIFNETVTITGLISSELVSGVTYTYSAQSATCATGGLCNVGDVGPSGGHVFYVSPSAINAAAGISTGGIYLEAAPVGAQGTAEFGCTGSNTPGTSYAVGSGAANTLAIINACATAGIAARVTSNLTYAGFSDWFMPSLDEMTAIYNNLYRNTPSLGGFTGLDYGSSSQGTNGNGYQAYWWFGNGSVNGQTNKNLAVAYRPVRAFNPTFASEVNYGPSTTKPTGAGTYIITPSALTFTGGTIANYVFAKYETSTLTINKARQDTLTITSRLAPFNGGSSTIKLITSGGTDTGTVTYSIATGGTASGCSVTTDVLTVTSAGTCNLVATKAATLNYLITFSDTVTVTFSQFVSSQQRETQLVPTQLPINGENSLETTTVTVPVITSISYNGGGTVIVNGNFQTIPPFYEINGSGFNGTTRVVLNFNDVTPFTLHSNIKISFDASAAGGGGMIFIETSDGRLGPVPFYNFTP